MRPSCCRIPYIHHHVTYAQLPAFCSAVDGVETNMKILGLGAIVLAIGHVRYVATPGRSLPFLATCVAFLNRSSFCFPSSPIFTK